MKFFNTNHTYFIKKIYTFKFAFFFLPLKLICLRCKIFVKFNITKPEAGQGMTGLLKLQEQQQKQHPLLAN